MKSDMQRNSQEYDDEIVLDLSGILDDYIRCIKKYWMWFILLIVIAAGLLTAVLKIKYEPIYRSQMSYAVTRTKDPGVDASVAKRLSGAIPAITQNGKFREELFENMEGEILNSNFAITSSFTKGANLFSVTVTSDNSQDVNRVLDAFERIYPAWADRSSGALELQVVDKSQSGVTPVNPYSMVKHLLMGVIGGAALCFIFATGYVLTIKTVRKESDMRKITVQSCIGLIPDVKTKKRAKSKKEQLLLTNPRLDWGFKQSILAVQARIQQQMGQKDSQVLLLTSTIPEEGKSILATNLALAFADGEKKVLLMDGDLRQPSVGELLGVEEGPGLTEYLKGTDEIDAFLSPCNKLSFLQAGQRRGNVSALLDERKMESLMAQLRERFDYIIIDTPPSYLFSDAAMLARYADNVVYVVRHDMAEIREVKKGMEPFLSTKKLMGYLINRSSSGFASYGKYGYGYGTYGKYGNYSKYKRYMELDEVSMNTEESLNDEKMQ